MTWFKVDDGLHSHPKWLAASPAARALWVTAGSWCAAHLTDGRIPCHVLSLFAAKPRDATELVRLDLWHETSDGWVFHDWAEFQPSAESVEAERAAARERQRRARDKSRASRRDSTRESPVTDAVSHGPPDPTRPDHDENSSSSDSRRPDPTVDEERPRNRRVETALAVLADRDLDKRQTQPGLKPIANVDAWTLKAVGLRRRRHGAQLTVLERQHPGLSPTELANLVEDTTPAGEKIDRRLDGQQAAGRAAAERHMAELERQKAIPVDPEANVTNIAAVRAGLRRVPVHEGDT